MYSQGIKSNGTFVIKIKKYSVKEILYFAFVFFCMFPFIFPFPLITTDLQPYAAIFATLIVILDYNQLNTKEYRSIFIFGILLLVVSTIIFFLSGISTASFRGFFNHYSLAIELCAVIIVARHFEGIPEKYIKFCILTWFFVCTVQFFITKSFAASIVSGHRSTSERGVFGLASEPSFLGIACFYMMHYVSRFKKNKLLFFVVVLIMGVLYAQSTLGIMFIGSFWIVYLLDNIKTKKGLFIFFGSIVFVITAYWILNRYLEGSRLFELVSNFIESGISGTISEDVSATVRLNSIISALENSFSSYLIPQGFLTRIGSGYGGFLCELGFFALPELYVISRNFAVMNKRTFCKVLYFIVITILLFNNTQMGNPLLILAIGQNCYYFEKEKKTLSRSRLSDEYKKI